MCFFLMIRQPPRSTRTDTLFPYTTLFRSVLEDYPYGGLAEYMIAPQYALVKLPDNVSFEAGARFGRSEEHTSELQSLMRISYAVFCLKKKKQNSKTPRHFHKQLA